MCLEAERHGGIKGPLPFEKLIVVYHLALLKELYTLLDKVVQSHTQCYYLIKNLQIYI